MADCKLGNGQPGVIVSDGNSKACNSRGTWGFQLGPDIWENSTASEYEKFKDKQYKLGAVKRSEVTLPNGILHNYFDKNGKIVATEVVPKNKP